MFVVGHVGITLGAARVAARGFDLARNRFGRSERAHNAQDGARRGRLSAALDDRVLALGSLLPDIIDKPLGLILASDLVGNSTRNVGHTLIFALALIAAAWAASAAFRQRWTVALALASAGHLALDEMWRRTETLFWPLLGWRFPQRAEVSVADWTAHTMTSAPGRLLDPLELIGLATICYIAARVLWSRGVKEYLLTGRMA